MDNEQPIFVTKPYLPPLDSITPYLESIWEKKILTNSGPLHNLLEERLAGYLGVPHVSLFSNATLALIVALRVLRLDGEVITPAFSFVATSQAITWNNLVPVFADIRDSDYCLDPCSVISKITPRTSAILSDQCYGNPGPVDDLQRIAEDYNLNLVYDAAHSFGVNCDCGSATLHGDLSILSFHATKVFNTFEGGAIICKDKSTKKKIDRLKNFGFVTEEIVASSGINAKMSEINAAIGLAQLDYINKAILERKEIAEAYIAELDKVDCIQLPSFYASVTKHNYAYFPIRVIPGNAFDRDTLFTRLREKNIFARKYFCPLISDFQYFKGYANDNVGLEHSAKASKEVLCLPIYPGMTPSEQERVVSAIKEGCK
jgi:dTDP-4-amino-4,6-dideoxygalactose transaminase